MKYSLSSNDHFIANSNSTNRKLTYYIGELIGSRGKSISTFMLFIEKDCSLIILLLSLLEPLERSVYINLSIQIREKVFNEPIGVLSGEINLLHSNNSA
jgi:hypothetical protein